MRKLHGKASSVKMDSVRSLVAIADFSTCDSSVTDKNSPTETEEAAGETLMVSVSIHRIRLAAVTAACIIIGPVSDLTVHGPRDCAAQAKVDGDSYDTGTSGRVWSQTPATATWRRGPQTPLTQFLTPPPPGNPIPNTLFRNLLLPPVPRGKAQCYLAASEFGGVDSESDTSLQLNFPQRAWQERVLSTALKPELFRMVVNPSVPTVNKGLKTNDLPMTASLAADLTVYSMLVGSWIFPFEGRGVLYDASAFELRYSNEIITEEPFTDAAARMYGLLPRDQRDELAQRDYFLNASAASISRVFDAMINTSKSDIVAEVSHVDISPSMAFDALTIEFTLDPSLFKDTFSFDNNRTRYTLINQSKQCGYKSLKCLIPKPAFAAIAGQFDPPAQVYGFQMCGTEEGLELLNATTTYTDTGYPAWSWLNDCSHGSNSSILVVSLGKRLEADTLHQNMTMNATTPPFMEDQAGDYPPWSAVATNLRKVYTLTVGRLAWQDVDLAKEFNAKCGVDTNRAGCRGLTLPLAPPFATDPTTSTDQLLVIGVDAIPTGQLDTVKGLELMNPSKRLLVSANEPRPLSGGYESHNIRAGDVLLPHNVATFLWDRDFRNVESACDEQGENNVQQILDNHFYIERSLQPAYTAGVFFLLQNAVVKDVVKLGTHNVTLDFEGNSQRIAIWISTPTLNAWLTYAGCLLIAIALLATIGEAARYSSNNTQDPLTRISNPQVIARAILDDAQFPPLLVKRCVVDGKDLTSQVAIEGYTIDSLTLSLDPEPEDTKPATTTGQTRPADVV